MFDVGGYGAYRRRTVEVIPIAGFLEWVKEVDDKAINKENWAKVDESYNPFNWKEI